MENSPITIKKISIIWPFIGIVVAAAMAWANSVNKIEALTVRMTNIEQNYIDINKTVSQTAQDVAFIRGVIEKKK